MDGNNVRGILRYAWSALSANIPITGGFHRGKQFLLMGAVYCQAFNQPFQLFGRSPFVGIAEPKLPVFFEPVDTVMPISPAIIPT